MDLTMLKTWIGDLVLRNLDLTEQVHELQKSLALLKPAASAEPAKSLSAEETIAAGDPPTPQAPPSVG